VSVLVLGGAGFIGSWLVEALLDRGERTVVLDNFATGHVENLAEVLENPRLRLVAGDARDRRLLHELVPGAGTVIHLAATVGADKVCEDPAHTYRNNVESTRRVLEMAAARSCRVFFASTSEVYAAQAELPLREDAGTDFTSRPDGRSAYRRSKLDAEVLCSVYQRLRGVDVVVGRLFNTIGPRQSSRHGMVVPSFVRQASFGEPITVYGDGLQTRCFCNVRDTVRAILELLERSNRSVNPINIGSDDVTTVQAVAEHVRARTGSRSPIRHVPPPHSRSADVEVRHRQPDIRMIERLTGWTPRVSWRETVDELITGAVDDRLLATYP
jgi:UDP-glucose 4-epimerase